jgi:tRNA(Ile)-lysidine synthetase-like protein
MTAISPYAPPGRKPHGAVNVHKRSRAATATGAVGLALVILKFWKHIPFLPKVIERLPKGLKLKLVFLLKNLPVGLKGTLIFLLHTLVQSLTGFKERLIMTGDEEQVRRVLSSFTIDSSALDLTSVREDDSSSEESEEVTETTHGGDQISEKSTRKHQIQIQTILRYWFGQYAPEQAEKKLWMISAQSTVWRDKVDQEITEQFGQILLELTSVMDEDETSTSTWKQWCNDSELYGYQGKMAAIIVLDQFSRHILRYKKNANSVIADDEPHSLQLLPTQTAIDRIAFKSAKLFMEKHATEIASGMIPIPMRIFALMPFRHIKLMECVEYVQGQVIVLEELDQQNNAMLKRFRKATNRRMAVLQDESRRTGNGTTQTDFSNTEILEHVAFTPKNMDDAAAHILHQTIQNFLHDRGIRPAPPDANGEHPTTPMIISLSGGVDSMVIAAVLAHMANAGKYRLQLTAVHIDYANRPESAAEAAYVGSYCEQLGIKYVCRRIEEVTRGETARDEYEQVARTARYDFYRQTVQDCRQAADKHHGDSKASTPMEVGVLLGHHRGDLRENVLSNAHKGNGPLDLSGMTAVSQNDGVSLYRPLLPLEKTSVFDYAHRFGVPYFKDTTPHWSTRGKLRNKLIPLLEEIYGEGSMNNLSNLAVESDECRALMQSTVLGPFLDQVHCLPMGISFDTTAWKSQGYFFWKFVLREALHSGGIGMFTAKSVMSFMERIQANKVKEGWLQCRKDCGVYLRRDGKVYCLYPASFPWRKADPYNTMDDDGDSLTVGYRPEESVMIGPWRVSGDLPNIPKKQPAGKLSTKAIGGMDDFMGGSIEYFLEAPTWWDTEKESFDPRPLVFTKFTKASRPKAWKSIDMKIQDILPLLGNDKEATKALQDPVGCGAVNDDGAVNPTVIVRVTLRLETESVH